MKRLLSLALRATMAVLSCLPAAALAAALDYAPDAVLGKPGFTTGRGGTHTATHLGFTAAIAQDPISGELWVADFDASRVLRFASAHAFANGEAANLVLGQADFTAGAANRGGAVAANTMNHPAGLAVDEARRLYVADTDNHRLLVFHPPFTNGMNATAVAGQADFGTGAPNRGTGTVGADTLNRPHGLAIEGAGIALLVADMHNGRVIRYALPIRSGALTVVGVLGQPGYSSNTPALTAAGLSRPAGVAFDPAGNLWVADQEFHRVTRYAADSLPFPGSGADLVLCQPDFVSRAAGVTDRACQSPTGVAIDGAGRVFVADFLNSRVLDFGVPAASNTGALRPVGQAGFNDQLCNRNLAAPREDTLCNPRALVFDRHGNLLVADAGNARVLRYDVPNRRPAPRIRAAGPPEPVPGLGDFAYTVNGSGFYADTVVRVGAQDMPTRYISPRRLVATLPAGVIPEPGGGIGVFVSTPQLADGPDSQTTMNSGLRQAADPLPDRVLGQAALRSTITEPVVHGAESLAGVDAATVGPFARGVAIDARTGRVFVADTARARVLSWAKHARFQNGEPADLAIGQPDFFSARCVSPTARTLCAPLGLAVDDAGRLHVSDVEHHRVLRFDPPFATGMAAAAVLGQGGSFTTGEGNKGGRSAASLSFPTGLAFGGGRLFVADSGNARVLAFDDPAADATADLVLGRGDMGSGPGGDPSAARIGIDLVGLGVDGAGRLFVADTGNHRVLRFSPPFASGMAADLVIGQQDFVSRGFGNTERTLRSPDGLAADAEGNLVVSDRDNNRVLRFAAPLSTGMAASGVLGQPGLDSSDVQAGPERTTAPTGVAVDGAGNVLVVGAADQRVLAYDRPFGVETSKRLVNIATRMPVLTGDDVLIGGFIIGGTAPKKVVVRARGPSLAPFGIANPLANPLLQLFSGANQVAVNDNWQQAANAAEIQASGFAPAHALESAVLMTLQPGAYTAIVSGAGGVTGVGIVEVFEVDGATSPLVNIATRGRVLTGDNVLIGGFVISGDSPQTVVIRARGPSLAAAGVPGVLANPLLRLFAGDGTPLLTNDDWVVAPNAGVIEASGFAPSDPRESAILVTLQPGAYTAVVSGVGGATGVAIVEVFVP